MTFTGHIGELQEQLRWAGEKPGDKDLSASAFKLRSGRRPVGVLTDSELQQEEPLTGTGLIALTHLLPPTGYASVC